MNQYIISHKIKTRVTIKEDTSVQGEIKAEVTFDNFTFKQDCTPRDGATGDSWIVEGEVSAYDNFEAYQVFVHKLDNIIPRICLVSQSFMDYGHESFVILRKNNNKENRFVFVRFNERVNRGLYLGKNERKSVDTLKSYQHPEALNFLQESINTENYLGKLALIFCALEAMAGKIEVLKNNGTFYETYNKPEMIKILGKELFSSIFGQGGLRHKFLHGDLPNFDFKEDHFRKIYATIIKYFNTTYNLGIIQEAVQVPRDYNGKNRFVFLLKAGKGILLKDVINSFDRDQYAIADKVNGYEVLDRSELRNY